MNVVYFQGDALITSCTYKTTDRENITLGGHGIKDEMCVNYMYYYPKIDLEVCKSNINTERLQDYFHFMHRWVDEYREISMYCLW